MVCILTIISPYLKKKNPKSMQLWSFANKIANKLTYQVMDKISNIIVIYMKLKLKICLFFGFINITVSKHSFPTSKPTLYLKKKFRATAEVRTLYKPLVNLITGHWEVSKLLTQTCILLLVIEFHKSKVSRKTGRKK